MEFQKGGRFEDNRRPKHSTCTQHKRAESQETAVERREIGSSTGRALEQQELLFEEEVFSDHSSGAPWPPKLRESDAEMSKKDENVLHGQVMVDSLLQFTRL